MKDPLGKLMARILPDWGFTLSGTRHSINPGPFNRKEHMLINICATCCLASPYTNNIIIVQYLPQYFNQRFAGSFGYQIVLGLAMNLGGYGLAGCARRFLVYPAYCVWPTSLVTIALNNGFHSERVSSPVRGPGNRLYSWSRMKVFYVVFIAMFMWVTYEKNRGSMTILTF